MEIIKHKILGYTPHVSPQFEIIFQTCSFTDNSLLRDRKDTFIGATVDIFSMERVTYKHCNFTRNNNTALSLVDSNLVLEGNILFDDNHAINGGALKFCDTSLVYIRKNTHIKFIIIMQKMQAVPYMPSSVAWRRILPASSNQLLMISQTLLILRSG